MGTYEKLLKIIMSGVSDNNIEFSRLINLLNRMGFDERIKGSHHIFSKEDIIEIINIQSRKDGKAKPYQIKQIRQIFIKYKLVTGD